MNFESVLATIFGKATRSALDVSAAAAELVEDKVSDVLGGKTVLSIVFVPQIRSTVDRNDEGPGVLIVKPNT